MKVARISLRSRLKTGMWVKDSCLVCICNLLQWAIGTVYCKYIWLLLKTIGKFGITRKNDPWYMINDAPRYYIYMYLTSSLISSKDACWRSLSPISCHPQTNKRVEKPGSTHKFLCYQHRQDLTWTSRTLKQFVATFSISQSSRMAPKILKVTDFHITVSRPKTLLPFEHIN